MEEPDAGEVDAACFCCLVLNRNNLHRHSSSWLSSVRQRDNSADYIFDSSPCAGNELGSLWSNRPSTQIEGRHFGTAPDGRPFKFAPSIIRHRSTISHSPSAYRLRTVVKRTTYIPQSAGKFSIPHTLPGSSIAKPSSQSLSCSPRLIQVVTLAPTGFETGSPCNRSGVPASTGREIRAVHPFGLTRITRHDSENGQSGSRLTAVIGMSQETRVPQRAFTFVEIEFLVEI